MKWYILPFHYSIVKLYSSNSKSKYLTGTAMGYVDKINTSSSGIWYLDKYGCLKAYSAVILLVGSYSNSYLNKSIASLDPFGNNFSKSLPLFFYI